MTEWKTIEGTCKACGGTVWVGPSHVWDYRWWCDNGVCEHHTPFHGEDQGCPEWITPGSAKMALAGLLLGGDVND